MAEHEGVSQFGLRPSQPLLGRLAEKGRGRNKITCNALALSKSTAAITLSKCISLLGCERVQPKGFRFVNGKAALAALVHDAEARLCGRQIARGCPLKQ